MQTMQKPTVSALERLAERYTPMISQREQERLYRLAMRGQDGKLREMAPPPRKA